MHVTGFIKLNLKKETNGRGVCKALMTVRRRGSGKWYVAKLEKYHKRQLVTPAMRHFLRSHKQECDSSISRSSSSFGSMGAGLTASLNVLAEDYNGFGKMELAP